MNSCSIRFTHWLFRVRNDTVKHRNSWYIYFKGYITKDFLITIPFLLTLLSFCSLTLFLNKLQGANPALAVTDAGGTECSLQILQSFFPCLSPCPAGISHPAKVVTCSRAQSCWVWDALMQVVSCWLRWDAELQLGVFAGGWKPFQFEYAHKSVSFSMCICLQAHTHMWTSHTSIWGIPDKEMYVQHASANTAHPKNISKMPAPMLWDR